MSMITGIVADIERASTRDGPGIRTVVFLKGCPLRCLWCHNPECLEKSPQMLFYPEKCISCGYCTDGCYSGAKVICGREMTVSEVMDSVLADRIYYGKTGGLTVSGGEPLMQPEFTLELSRLSKASGIKSAIETSLFYFDEVVLRSFNLIMFDLKLPDDERHKLYTGVPASLIKEHILECSKLGIPMYARTPVVPGVNADIDTIAEISEFLYKIPAVQRYELLPYHPLGEPKRAAIGLPATHFETPPKSLIKELERYAFVR
jgi:pyruvate-formate lyase-activating enzyme